MKIDYTLAPADLQGLLNDFWELSAEKIRLIEQEYDLSQGSPVFTVDGKYSTRGWTEWTEGFCYGSGFLQYDATGDAHALDYAIRNTVSRMASHVSHIGVHDHGFNNLSTYGNWLRLIKEGKIPADEARVDFCELAIKASSAVQAARWSTTHEGGGYIYSFNGPQSLFVDTIRSCRILMVGHQLGHSLMGENDQPNNLLERALKHIEATAKYAIYYGEGRDSYDEWGRTAHESLFNVNDGRYRAPNAQQGYSGFTTWTRGLAWAMVGFAEELEFLQTLSDEQLDPFGGRDKWVAIMEKAAKATCDWYVENTSLDGITYWDGGAPQLHQLGDWRSRNAEPYNVYEPVDSSASAIGAQGLLRLGNYLGTTTERGKKYWHAGLTTLKSLLKEPYLSQNAEHQGLLLHSVYHQPNGWDNVPQGQSVACDESSMWGDYHFREAALLVHKMNKNEPYLTFYNLH